MESGTPKSAGKKGLIIARSDGSSIEYFPQYRPAVEYKRIILAQEPLLRALVDAMQNASERAARLSAQRAERFPKSRSYAKSSFEEREIDDEIATWEIVMENAAVAIVMILDGPLRRLGAAIERDTRDLGGPALNGMTLSRAIWALGNRQRHLEDWQKCSPADLAGNASVSALRVLDIDPLGPLATYEVLAACAFESYEDLEGRLLRVSDQVLESSGLIYEVTPSGYNINIRFQR